MGLSTTSGRQPCDPEATGSLEGMETNATTVVQGRTEDLIATVWFTLGFKPSESLVLAAVEGPRRRIGMILRLDLPGPGARKSELRRPVRAAMESIEASGAEAVIALVACENALRRSGAAILPLLQHEARVMGLVLVDVLGVTSTAYRSLCCPDRRCCPAAGLPIAAVMASRAAATFVLHGETVVDTEDDLIADVIPAPGAPDGGVLPGPRGPDAAVPGPVRTVAPVTAVGRVGPIGSVRLAPSERWRWWRIWTEAFGAIGSGAAEPGISLSGLSGALYDPHLRDAVMLCLLGCPQHQLTRMLNEGSGAPDGTAGPEQDAVGRASAGADGSEPDLGLLLTRPPAAGRLENGRAVLAGAARVAPPGERAPVLAVLALLSWYQGKTGRSRLLAERARLDFPALSLTNLVETLLHRRVPPPWLQMGGQR